ncbi:flippase-like domain-containing protein [bacterium]|nr:flippase-like domain-containing protein [bacterium]
MAKTKLIRYLKFFLKLLVSGGALVFVFSRIDIAAVKDLILGAEWGYLLLALAIFSFSKLVAAFRLNRFFHCIQVQLPTSDNIRLYLLGMFYNLFLPGGIGGDGYKIYLLHKKYKVKVRKLFWAVFLDRISGIFALGILALLLALSVPVLWPFRYGLVMLIPLAYAIAYWGLKRWFPQFKSIFVGSSAQSLLVQGSQVLSAVLILLAVAPEAINVHYLFLFLVSSIVSIVPITIGGAGARELTFLYGAEYLNIDLNSAIALSLTFYLITLLVSFCGIFYTFRESTDSLLSAK